MARVPARFSSREPTSEVATCAVLGSDGVHDATYQQISNAVWPVPIHTLGIVVMAIVVLCIVPIAAIVVLWLVHVLPARFAAAGTGFVRFRKVMLDGQARQMIGKLAAAVL